MATPAERSTIARIAANARWSQVEDRTAAMAHVQGKNPSSIEYWMNKVDPDRRMSSANRLARAENAKKAHYDALLLKARKAKARKAAGEAA